MDSGANPYETPAVSGQPPAGQPAETPSRSYVQTLIDLFIAPGEGFADLVKKPRVLVVLVLATALSLLMTSVWLSKADMYEMVRGQSEAAGRPAPPREAIPVGIIKGFTWGVTLVAPTLFNVIFAGVAMLIFNFGLGASARFKTLLSVLAHAGLAFNLVTVPLTLLIYFLKNDWNVPPDQILMASPAAFLDRATASKALYALAGKFDLLFLWLLTLCSIGLGKATGRSTGSAAWVVFGIYGFFSLIHIAWKAFVG